MSFDDVILIDSVNRDAHLSKAQALSGLGKYNESIECNNRAI
jgi:hypothetical protein